MPRQKQGESFHQFAIRVAWDFGHFWSPSNLEGHAVQQSDLPKLKISDDVVVKALISLSKSSVGPDGKIRDFQGPTSPEMKAILEESRCPVPDHAPPPGVNFLFDDPDIQQIALRMQERATGNGGNWPGCHNIGDFHCAAMRVNPAGMNPRVVPLWKQIMINVRAANASIGLLWKFIGMDNVDLLTGEKFTGTIQTDLTFVPSSSGWIGLAIVTTNEPCSTKIWLKLLSSYLGGTTDEQITRQVSALLQHEAGHNEGLGHTTGGIMNPSLGVAPTPGIWAPDDPSFPRLKTLYGGVPVPIPGDGPTPPPPPSTLEARVHALEVQNAVNKVTLDWCVTKIHELGG